MKELWRKPYLRGTVYYIPLPKEISQYGVSPRRAMRDPGHMGAGNWWESGRKITRLAEANRAVEEYRQLWLALQAGQPIGQRLTEGLVEQYIQERKRLSYSAFTKSRQAAEELLADQVGQPLKGLTITATLDRLRLEPNQRGGGTKTPKHLAGIFTALRTFMEWLAEVTGEDVAMPKRPSWLKGSTTVTKRHGFTREAWDALLEAADAKGLGLMVRLYMATGLRKMEGFGLRWEDFELQGDGSYLVHVRHQVMANAMTELVPTKGKAERVTILADNGAEFALMAPGRTGWVLDRELIKTCDDTFREVLEEAGLRVHGELWHMLRHTFAWSVVAELGYDLLSQLLGHKSVKTTEQYYPGLRPKEQALAAIKRLNQARNPEHTNRHTEKIQNG